MKVLFFPSDNNKTSGAFICMVQTIKHLRETYNVECMVVLPYEGDGTKLLDDLNIPSVVIKSKHWIVPKNEKGFKKFVTDCKFSVKHVLNYIAISKAKKLIKSFKPDIVHLNTTFCYIGAEAANKCNVPVVWHLRELVEDGMGKKIWNKKYGFKLMNRSAKILCVSGCVKETYKDMLKKDLLEVVYDGVEVSNYPFEENKDTDFTYFLSVGALGEHKGISAIIKACKLLKDRKTNNFKLFLVGRGPSEDMYRNLIKELGVEDVVELCGAKDNVRDFYHKAHFTIVNGYKEGFGRVTVEAMLSGSYVIGCNTGGTIELTQGGRQGLVFRHNDVEDLYSKMSYAIDNRETLMNRRRERRKYAEEHYSAEINAANVYSAYERVLASRK